MHATEWAGGVAALHFVHKLLNGYGKDERVTRLLDTRTVYVLPRMSPDGVDATLDEGRFIRSVDRPYPSTLPGPGIIPRDINGDGRAFSCAFAIRTGRGSSIRLICALLEARAPDEVVNTCACCAKGRCARLRRRDSSSYEPEHEAIDFGANFRVIAEGRQPDRTPRHPTSETLKTCRCGRDRAPFYIVAHVTVIFGGDLCRSCWSDLGERLPEPDRLAYETQAGKAAALTGDPAIFVLDLRSVDRETPDPERVPAGPRRWPRPR